MTSPCRTACGDFGPPWRRLLPQAFYHHLLVPRMHYLPVWRHGRGPEDILEALDWAQAHDEEARRIAQAGQVGVGAGFGAGNGAWSGTWGVGRAWLVGYGTETRVGCEQTAVAGGR